MSFDPAKMATLPYPSGFTPWRYETDDDARQMAAPDYFNIAAGWLRRGDMIFSSSPTSKETRLFLVTSVTEAQVTVAPLDADVTSVFGRTGAVTAADGDYSAAQVGAPPLEREIAAGGSLTGGGNLSANRTLSLVGDAINPGSSKYYGTNAAGAKGFHGLPAAGVTSVFGRNGAVVAQNGDYNAGQVGAVGKAEKGAANGVATLDGSAKLVAAQLPSHSHPLTDVIGLQAALDAKASIREAMVAAYMVAASDVGRSESVVIGKAVAAITLTLTTERHLSETQRDQSRHCAPDDRGRVRPNHQGRHRRASAGDQPPRPLLHMPRPRSGGQ